MVTHRARVPGNGGTDRVRRELRSVALAPPIAGGFAVALGIVVLVGWALDVEALKSILPGHISMKPNTAACFVMLGTALVLLAPRSAGRGRRLVGQVLALTTALVGLLSSSEYAFGWDLGIDQILFREKPGAVYTMFPGRMSLVTAVSFVILGAALLLANAHGTRLRRLVNLALALVMLFSLTTVVAYPYGTRSLFLTGVKGFTPMAFHTAIALLVLAVGTRLARPDLGFAVLAASGGPGGTIVRRLVPMVVVLVPALGYLRILGEKAGWYGQEAGVGLYVAATTTVLVLSIGFTAWTADRIDAHRQRLAQELREHTERVSDLYNNAPVGYHSLGPDGTFIEMNETELEWLGYSRDEVVGKKRFVDVTTPAGVQTFHELFPVFKEQGYIRDVEIELVRRDGTIFPVLVNSTAIRDEDGDFVRTRSTVVDITERKSADDALRRSEAFLDSVVENIPNMVFVKETDDLRFVRFNRAGEELLGYSREDLIGRNDYDFFPKGEADFFTSKDREVLERGQVLDIPEEPIDTRSKGRRYLHTKKVPILDDGGRPQYLLGISEDITELKRTHEELREAKEEAERANRAKDEFLSRMSHELRTPLNAILGFAQMLEGGDMPRDQIESVRHIRKGGELLLELINEVLDVSRIGSGRLSLSPEPVGVSETLREVVALARPLAHERGVSVRLEDANGLHVLADRQRLKQVFLNLLSNAIKYNREGGDVEVRWDKAGDGRLRISVSDTGLGIPPEALGRLFEPFERLGAEGTGVEGTGLGLALSRTLVEAMGGTIDVESEVGVGSRFSVELALAEPQARRYERERGPRDVPVPGPEQTVLYVEDNLSNLRLIERILERRPGVRLLSAMQGRLALDLARQHHPALILLDLHLPDLPGEQVLRELRRDAATMEIPVVVISADATHSQIKRLLAAGASDYTTKPIDVGRFLEVVDGALEGGQSDARTGHP